MLSPAAAAVVPGGAFAAAGLRGASAAGSARPSDDGHEGVEWPLSADEEMARLRRLLFQARGCIYILTAHMQVGSVR